VSDSGYSNRHRSEGWEVRRARAKEDGGVFGVAAVKCTERANYLAWGKDSETQVKPFYEFKSRKELDRGALV
jgi:hypothetical protein